jgi:hypothetical protein
MERQCESTMHRILVLNRAPNVWTRRFRLEMTCRVYLSHSDLEMSPSCLYQLKNTHTLFAMYRD